MVLKGVSNPLLSSLSKRLDKYLQAMLSFEDDIKSLSRTTSQTQKATLKVLNDTLVYCRRKNRKLSMMFKTLEEEHLLASLSHTRWGRYTDKNLLVFYDLDLIFNQLMQMPKPLVNYIMAVDTANNMPVDLVSFFKLKHLEEKPTPSAQALSLLTEVQFNELLQTRNTIKRARAYQRNAIQSAVNRAFSPLRLIIRMIFNPKRYWNKKSIDMFSMRVPVRLRVVKRMQYNDMLCQLALDRNLDHFIHRWLCFTSLEDFSHCDDIEQLSIQRLMSIPGLKQKLIASGDVPLSVIDLIDEKPLVAFKLMLKSQEKLDNTSPLVNQARIMGAETSSASMASSSSPLFDYSSEEHGLENILDSITALYDKDKAKQLFAKSKAIADGVWINASPRPLFYPKSKRLKNLSTYRRLLQRIDALLSERFFSMTVLRDKYLHVVYRIYCDMKTYYKKNQQKLSQTEAGLEVKALLEKLQKDMKEHTLKPKNEASDKLLSP